MDLSSSKHFYFMDISGEQKSRYLMKKILQKESADPPPRTWGPGTSVPQPGPPAGTQTTQSSRYNTVAKTPVEIYKIEPVVRQELRSTLDQNSLPNLRQYAMSPLKQTFNLPNVQDDSELLAKSCTISSKLSALKVHLEKYNMIDSFMIITPLNDNNNRSYIYSAII